MKACLIIVMVWLPWQAKGAPGQDYHLSLRLKAIINILNSLENTPKDQLFRDYNWLSLQGARTCDTEFLSVKISCMIENAKAYCKENYGTNGGNCLAYMDMMIVNSLNESMFISSREKYHLLKSKGFSEDQFHQVLENRYGELATSFAMSRHFVCGLEREACFAEGLDSFCIEFSDKGRLPYQACLGALMRFTVSQVN